MPESRVFKSPLPRRMQKLPVDERGYPVPWFVAYVDGKPEFRAMDAEKFRRALRDKLCWVCGETRGVYAVFVVGPMCGVNRVSSEPPSHLDCARWSAENCPFLSDPHMVRREDETVNNVKLVEAAAGHAICRNPGVALLWVTRSFEILPDGAGKFLLMMGEPESVEWWREGRAATRAEVEAAVESGLPILEAMAAKDRPEALAALAKSRARLEPWLPREAPTAAR